MVYVDWVIKKGGYFWVLFQMDHLVYRNVHCTEERRSQICSLQENVEFMHVL